VRLERASQRAGSAHYEGSTRDPLQQQAGRLSGSGMRQGRSEEQMKQHSRSLEGGRP